MVALRRPEEVHKAHGAPEVLRRQIELNGLQPERHAAAQEQLIVCAQEVLLLAELRKERGSHLRGLHKVHPVLGLNELRGLGAKQLRH